MTISIKIQKMLWGRAAGRCSKPECRIELHESETETDNPALIGENCHIVAESDDGPRANPAMPIEERNSYDNLILLCRNHHKIVDDQQIAYPVELLHQMKAEHQSWVTKQLNFDAAKQFDDEQYAGTIDTWERLAHLDEWHAWSSHVLGSGQPSIWTNVFRDLGELRTWLLNRIWPGRYPDLEGAFDNFRRVLQDFHEQFRKHAEPFGDDELITKKFYHIPEWNHERYHKLARDYEFHVDLVEDLLLELTRSANLVADRVRQHLIRNYRLSKGHLVVEYGPTADLSFTQAVVQYQPHERNQEFPYPGLEAFQTKRAERDLHFGKGTRSDPAD